MVFKRKMTIVLATLAVAWVALFYSGRAVLVWQWTDEDEHRLTCRYVAANMAFERTHLYTESGVFGRAACPRLLKVRTG